MCLILTKFCFFRVGKRINKECDVVAMYSPFSENDCGFVSLGEYSSKEKAIKVLDMIQIAYEEANSVCSMSGFVANTVFQMPADKEV